MVLILIYLFLQSTGKGLYYVDILAYHYQQHDQQGNGDGTPGDGTVELTAEELFVMQHRKREGTLRQECFQSRNR